MIHRKTPWREIECYSLLGAPYIDEAHGIVFKATKKKFGARLSETNVGASWLSSCLVARKTAFTERLHGEKSSVILTSPLWVLLILTRHMAWCLKLLTRKFSARLSEKNVGVSWLSSCLVARKTAFTERLHGGKSSVILIPPFWVLLILTRHMAWCLKQLRRKFSARLSEKNVAASWLSSHWSPEKVF